MVGFSKNLYFELFVAQCTVAYDLFQSQSRGTHINKNHKKRFLVSVGPVGDLLEGEFVDGKDGTIYREGT